MIESSLNGGTMHTMKFAQKQNRSIAVMKPPVMEETRSCYAGNQSLLSIKNIVPLETTSDLTDFLENRVGI